VPTTGQADDKQRPAQPHTQPAEPQVRSLLESHYDFLWVDGEVSNFAAPSSGHWYFSLKDEKAQVRCAMFRNRNQRLRYRPQNGDAVRLRARVSLYEGRGEFQLIGEFIEPAGAGALQARFEACATGCGTRASSTRRASAPCRRVWRTSPSSPRPRARRCRTC
jgi:hypothetical protein